MSTNTMQRRLAAIVHADVAGFTRMMEGAETRTFRHLKRAMIDVWRPAIQNGGGRMVGTAGDAMLAEFGSAVQAVLAAIDIQERMAEFNGKLDASQQMMFRVGVHLGEVIVDEEDQNIFGDGVNLAARIQALAEPGGIAVSRAVRDLTELRTEYVFVDAGDHQLKNVSRAIQVFHVKHASQAQAAVQQAAPIAPARAVPQITLQFDGSDSKGQKYAFDVALDKLAILPEGMGIGRAGDQCELVLSHATVSRRHARLMLKSDVLQVEDLGSTNGTAVNGAVIKPGQPVPLQAGGKLRIGDVELLIVELLIKQA
jgi:adenylate cyclase